VKPVASGSPRKLTLASVLLVGLLGPVTEGMFGASGLTVQAVDPEAVLPAASLAVTTTVWAA
jgi:hypothetical protein